MKLCVRILAWALLAVLVVGCFPAGAETVVFGQAAAYPAGDPAEVAAVILHTNDVHVALQNNIGYDGLALYRKELEQLYDHVLLVDAGDAIQGAPVGVLSKGADIIRVMNKLGYDLAIPGNHEFDFGFDVLDDCSEQLLCGYTCANFCTADGEPVFSPWRMLEAGDLRIAFVGVVTPYTFTKTSIKDILNEVGEPMYDFLADNTGERLVAALQKAVDEARAGGADQVILVSHLGSDRDATGVFGCNTVAGKLQGVDMIIDGHSHERFSRTVTDRTGRQIPVAQTGSNLRTIGQLTVYKDGRLEERLIDTVPEPSGLPAEKVIRGNTERWVDPEMKDMLDGIYEAYADTMQQKIGTLSFDMPVRDENDDDISRMEENPLCNLVTDAYCAIGKTQTALINAGSVRNNLEAGEITFNSVLNILPYSNDVITAKVTGRMIMDALEFGVSVLPEISAGFPQVSGISFRVNAGIPSSVRKDEKNQFLSVDGEYRVSDVRIGGEPLSPDAEYTMTLSTFVFSGGDGYTMFRDAEMLSSTMLPDNGIVIRYIVDDLNGVIPDRYREPEGRIVIDTASAMPLSAGAQETEDAAAQAALTLEEYLERGGEAWFLTGKKEYGVQAKMVSEEISFHNDLEVTDYTVADDGVTVVLKGCFGEMWASKLPRVLSAYVRAGGAELREEDFAAKDVWIGLVTRPEPDAYCAMYVPLNVSVTVETAWGDVLHTNLSNAPHGDGDYLVCRADENGEPDLSDIWVVNGVVFSVYYDLSFSPDRSVRDAA